MKRLILRLALVGIFTLSTATATALFADVTANKPIPLISCPHCGVGLTCGGSPCTCEYNGITNQYVCVPPTQ